MVFKAMHRHKADHLQVLSMQKQVPREGFMVQQLAGFSASLCQLWPIFGSEVKKGGMWKAILRRRLPPFSCFLLGFSVGQAGARFHMQADFSKPVVCWGVQTCSIPPGELPQRDRSRGPLSMQQQPPLAQVGVHPSGRHCSESGAAPLFSGIKELDLCSHMNRAMCKQGLQLFSWLPSPKLIINTY